MALNEGLLLIYLPQNLMGLSYSELLSGWSMGRPPVVVVVFWFL